MTDQTFDFNDLLSGDYEPAGSVAEQMAGEEIAAMSKEPNDEIPDTNPEVYNKLLTLEQVKELLAYTEPVITKTVTLDGTTDGIVVFSLPAGWNIGLKDKDGLELTQAEIAVGGNAYTLSKDAVLDFTKAIGLPDSYVFKTPGVMIQSHLNYWASHSPDLQIKMLLHEESVLSTTKNGITPFSNLDLLDKILEVVDEAGYPKDEVLFDWKSHHDLNITSLRMLLSIPDVIGLAPWVNGLEFRKSLTGSKPISVRGYMFKG